MSPPDPRVGQILQGRYRIMERVAAGAMGVVYRGERVMLARPVAVKFLHPWIASQQAFRTRFETEARAMSRLSHPNCVSVIDFGLEGSPYVVMDFIAGSTLRQLLGGGRLAPVRAVGIARQLLAGVAHAHAQGIVHRDLKPENLILGDTAGLADHVRILDFGLAKLRDGPAMTAGMAIGTPGYMSPEQTGAPGEIDGRTDIYAVGILLFEMLAGRKPFVSEKIAEILLMHRDTPPPSLRQLVPEAGISGELEDVVNRALAKRPESRFGTATEFAQALDQVPEAVAARASGDFPSPVASGFGSTVGGAGVPVLEAEKTIADQVPSHLAGIPPALSTTTAKPSSTESGLFTLGGAKRWVGLLALAALASVLVLVGVRRHPPSAAPSPSSSPIFGSAGLPAAGAGGGSGAGVGVALSKSPVAAAKPLPTVGAKVAVDTTPIPVTVRPPAPSAPSEQERMADADRLIGTGEWEQAIVVLGKAHHEHPDSAVASYRLANLLLDHKRWGEGAQAARLCAQRDPKYRADETLVKNLIRSLAIDKGYEKTEDVLHGFGAGAVPFLKHAAAHDGNPVVRQRAAELLRGHDGSRNRSRVPSSPARTSSSRSLFSR